MRKLLSAFALLSCLVLIDTAAAAARDLFVLKAGMGSWGSAVKIHDCSTEANSWVQFFAERSNTGSPIVYQMRTSRNWQDVAPGQIIEGQTVRLRGRASDRRVQDNGDITRRTSSGGGDFVNIRVTGYCSDNIIKL